MVTTKNEYREVIERGNRGHYPRVLTTDGETISQEYRHNHDGWECDNTMIAYVMSPDDWPSFSEANRRRIAVKKGTFQR